MGKCTLYDHLKALLIIVKVLHCRRRRCRRRRHRFFNPRNIGPATLETTA